MSLSSIADAATACKRLHEVFEAETSERTLTFDGDLSVAVRINGADFTWDSPPPKSEGLEVINDRKGVHVPTPQPVDEANIFKLRGINMEIPRGRLVAIVGAIGVGKSSLLQALIGEMRRIAGTVEFGGSVAYCAQTAWIQVCFFKLPVIIMDRQL